MPESKEDYVKRIKEAAGLAASEHIKINYGNRQTTILNEFSKSKQLVNNLTPEKTQDILGALSKPAEARSPILGEKSKNPNLKISVETAGKKPDVILRREQNGTISVNQVSDAQLVKQAPEAGTSVVARAKDNLAKVTAIKIQLSQLRNSPSVNPEMGKLLRRWETDISNKLSQLQSTKDKEQEVGTNLVQRERSLKNETYRKVDQLNNAKQSLQSRAADYAETAARNIGGAGEHLGQSIIKGGQWLQQGSQWLQQRPQAIRNYKSAEAVVEAFKRGQQRLPSHDYSLNETHFISRETQGGTTKYYVSEMSHNESRAILSFSQDNNGKIANISQHGDYNYEHLATSTAVEIPRADPAKEVQHQLASQKVAEVAKVRLMTQSAMDGKEATQANSKNYTFSTNEQGGITIRAKDGRGVVLEANSDGVKSKLNAEDFKRFAPVVQQLNSEQSRTQAREQEEVSAR